MKYFVHWYLGPDGWTPERVFVLDDEGEIVGNILDRKLWDYAKANSKAFPDGRRPDEVDKEQAELLAAEIKMKTDRMVSSIYDFRPDAYITIRGAELEEEFWEDAGYVRIRRVLKDKRYLVDLLGINDDAAGPLTEVLYRKGASGDPERVTQMKDLQLGGEYVLEWTRSMATTPKDGILILREEGHNWRHYPDAILDAGDEESFPTR